MGDNVKQPYTVVMGMGKTGIACAQFLHRQGVQLHIMDNRTSPPNLATLRHTLPDIAYTIGQFEPNILAQAQEIVISPGLSLEEPALQQARQAQIPIISEIELFARHVNAPVIAITGSNGKSTVTTLVGDMAKETGADAQVGGNLGTPAITLLKNPPPDFYVLELSSFQLETTYSLKPHAAVVLNISADHMDRYTDLAHYAATKQKIYHGNGMMIINQDDAYVIKMQDQQREQLTFSITDTADFHLQDGYLMYHDMPLLSVKKLYLQNKIMYTNALAALALGKAMGLSSSAMKTTLQQFRGLAHRCEWVANIHEVDWFNDSKGTNVGATVAAVQGLEKAKHIVLIAGGEGKGADFSPLSNLAKRYLKACILIGRDTELIRPYLEKYIPVQFAKTMQDAVYQAHQLSQAGDSVLLSPACASFDMFDNYEHRGHVFIDAVHQLKNSIELV